MRTISGIFAAVLATVAETPDGAPQGVLFAGLFGFMTHADFRSMIARGVADGLLETRQGGLLVFATKRGRELAAELQAAQRRTNEAAEADAMRGER